MSYVSGFGSVGPDLTLNNQLFDHGDQIDINELQNYIQSPIRRKGLWIEILMKYDYIYN